MWFEKRGIVAKINEESCIIITPEGTYKKIPLPAQGAEIGAEIAYNNTRFSPKLKPLFMAASFLIIFMSYALLRQAFLPQAVAYVSLDINPSLEMSIDKNLRVIDVQCLNDDANLLIKQVTLKGKGLNEALAAVVNEAIKQNYINPGQDNLVISTVTPVGDNPVPVDEQEVCRILENSVNSDGLSGQVKIYSASHEFRTAAENNSLSPGKYLIYQQLLKAGKKITVDEVKNNPVRKLVDSYKVELLPNYKKISIQKSQNSNNPEVDVDDNGRNIPIEDYLKAHPVQDDNSSPRQDSHKANQEQNNSPGGVDKQDSKKNESHNNKAHNNPGDHNTRHNQDKPQSRD